MAFVNLCMGQGVTAIRDEFKGKAIDEMLRRAALIRDRVPQFIEHFETGPIELGGTTPLSRDYDHPVAFYKAYRTSNLPGEGGLVSDLRAMLGLYDLLVSRGGVDNVEGALEAAADQESADLYKSVEERRQYVRHNRIDRRSTAAIQAKKVHGFICQGCGFDFEAVYGELGREYIEAHHLIPLSSLPEGKSVPMDPKTDFAVLCSNCHRMVHRRKEPLSVEALKSLVASQGKG
jgi:5-methylcytosine-specific restriction protein A